MKRVTFRLFFWGLIACSSSFPPLQIGAVRNLAIKEKAGIIAANAAVQQGRSGPRIDSRKFPICSHRSRASVLAPSLAAPACAARCSRHRLRVPVDGLLWLVPDRRIETWSVVPSRSQIAPAGHRGYSST